MKEEKKKLVLKFLQVKPLSFEVMNLKYSSVHGILQLIYWHLDQGIVLQGSGT